MSATAPYKLRIEGMDCGACALKIETAMKRLPGVSDINVSYSGGTLALQLDKDRTTPSTIESKIKALGFTPVAEEEGAKATGRPREKGSWWSSGKARLVLMIGALFAVAFVAATEIGRAHV